MDLTQAEAVADLITAKTESAARLAEKQLSGRLGETIRILREKLTHLLAEFESRLDFSEENLDWLPPEQCLAEMQNIATQLDKLIRSAANGAILRDGVNVVIAGRPNAGKSSLLNALLGFDRAIVTEIPGTTRDTLEEFASIRNIPVRLTDTAGLHDSVSDPVERLGIQRSLNSLKGASCVFWVLDASSPEAARESADYFLAHRPEGHTLIALWNKTDQPGSPATLPKLPDELTALRISAVTGTGLDVLLDRFAELVWQRSPDLESNGCEVSARHADLLKDARQDLERGMEEVRSESWELAAFTAREIINALGKITGETVSPDILDEIFSRFCIGK